MPQTRPHGMSLQRSRKEAEEPRMSTFERNRYFNGKLMTAGDMQVEQEYHRGRLHALSQRVLGSGLVCGLRTKDLVEREGRLYATVEPGLGLDRRGRPVVVEEQQEVLVRRAGDKKDDEPKAPDNDDIYLFLTYDECLVDAVPVPDSRNACEERCCYNRVVEDFELIYTEDRPERYKQVPKVEFPSEDDLDAYEGESFDYDPALTEMARSYYKWDCERNTVECGFDCDCSLFLGHFKKRGKAWEFRESSDRRPFVYTNDMLYAIIARHVTDFNNPHEVEVGLEAVEGVRNPGGNVDFTSDDGTIGIEGFDDDDRVNFDVTDEVARAQEVERLNSEVEDLKDCVEDLKDCVRGIVGHLNEQYQEDIELGEACDRLCEERDTPKQEPQRQKDYEENNENEDETDIQ